MNPREASPAASDSIEQAVNDALESNDSNLVNDLLQASELNRFANVPLQLNAPQGPPRYQSRPMFPPRRTAAPRPNVPVPQNVSTSVPQNIQATQNIAPSAQNAASAQTDQPQENGMVPPPQEPRRPQPAQAVVNDFIAIRAFLIRQGFFYRLDGGRIGLVVHHSDLRRQTGPGIEHHVLQAVRIYLHLVQGFDLPDLDTLYIGPQLDMDRNGRTFVVSEDFVASTRAAFAIIGVYNVEDCPFGGRNSFGSYAEQEQAALNWLRSVTRRQLCMSDLATE